MSGTILQDIEKLLATSEPPELGPGPRPGILPEAELESKLDKLFDRGEIAAAKQPLIRALVLLWHDHLDAAHVIAQAIDNADGAFVHGIMHRREPDYGNAKYWFRRVGNHPAFADIAKRATVLLDAKDQSALLGRLAPNGEWDSFALIDLCEEAAKKKTGDPTVSLLREIQRIETEALLDTLCSLRD